MKRESNGPALAAPIGQDPRGHWAWQPYKPSNDEKEAFFKQKARLGADLYCQSWSSITPFLRIVGLDETGVTYFCHAWAEKEPRRDDWPGFFRWIAIQGGGIDSYI